MTTAMAYAAFADAPVDVAVVEVGLGGEDDATNVLEAGVCVITPIGLDHTEWLGDTIEDIAWAKAGIIHKGATVVTAVQTEEAMRPLLRALRGDGRDARPRGRRVRRRRPRPRGRRSGADPAGPRRRLRRGVPAAVRRAPGAERRARAGRGRGVPRRGQGQAARPGRWSGRDSPLSTHRAGWNGSEARRRSCWTARTTRTAWPRRSARWRRSSRSVIWSRSSRCWATRM